MWSPLNVPSSQGGFRQVARANHKSIDLIGDIHENLGSLACLRIFVGDIEY